jgi:hypothetical protein
VYWLPTPFASFPSLPIPCVTVCHHISTGLHFCGRVISPTQRSLPDTTQHSKETDIHAHGGIRTRKPSKRVAADPRLIPSTMCSSSGGQNCIIQHLVSSQESSLNLCTGRPPTGVMIPDSGIPRWGRGFGGVQPPSKFRKPSKIMPNSTRL